MKFRRATEGDLERLVEIHLAAYPDRRSVAARERNFTHHPFGGLDDVVVVEVSGNVVGHAFLFSLLAGFGGVDVATGAIASLGIAPEARGRGVATALMAHLHKRASRAGAALTMLSAYRQGFYARFGYASTSSRRRLALDTRSIPDEWRKLARERVRGVEARDREAIRSIHARAARRASGWVHRPARFWEMVCAREERVALVCERPSRRPSSSPRASGYVAFSMTKAHFFAETKLEVDELIADDPETRRALLGALSLMKDQVSEIVVELASDDPLERALVDPDGRRFGTDSVEHELGTIVGGPMVKILDAKRALSARGYTADGVFDVALRDRGDASDVTLGVRVCDGRADVGAPLRRGAFRTTRAGLAAVLFGGLSLLDAVTLGLVDAEPRVVDRIDEVLRIPPLAPIDSF